MFVSETLCTYAFQGENEFSEAMGAKLHIVFMIRGILVIDPKFSS